jgi:hypothetical protein
MLDECEKRAYEQQWQAKERVRVAQNMAVRERAKADFAAKIAERAEWLRREKGTPLSR